MLLLQGSGHAIDLAKRQRKLVRSFQHVSTCNGFGCNCAAAGDVCWSTVEHSVGTVLYYGYPNVGAWRVPSRRGYF